MSWLRRASQVPESPARDGRKASRLRDDEERSAGSWNSATLFGPWADHETRCKCNVCR